MASCGRAARVSILVERVERGGERAHLLLRPCRSRACGTGRRSVRGRRRSGCTAGSGRGRARRAVEARGDQLQHRASDDREEGAGSGCGRLGVGSRSSWPCAAAAAWAGCGRRVEASVEATVRRVSDEAVHEASTRPPRPGAGCWGAGWACRVDRASRRSSGLRRAGAEEGQRLISSGNGRGRRGATHLREAVETACAGATSMGGGWQSSNGLSQGRGETREDQAATRTDDVVRLSLEARQALAASLSLLHDWLQKVPLALSLSSRGPSGARASSPRPLVLVLALSPGQDAAAPLRCTLAALVKRDPPHRRARPQLARQPCTRAVLL